ncbi:hypothetical protein [Streptomyces sp. NPDC001985]|uniref:hypothetical protein n=1 Tax=Streptomyces sp. NPDC001985 TaxID=3154406 RepID=UPI00331A1948
MAEGDVLWTIRGGEKVDVPATLAGIRDALPPGDRERFVNEVFAANMTTVEQVVREWIVKIASESEDEEILEQLRAEEGAA